MADVTGNNCPQNNYNKIQITTNKSWTFGLNIKKVTFDIVLSEPASMDIDLTISNLENAENYNKDKDTYYYHKTLTITKQTTSVTLEINDTFTDKESVFSFEVVESCYTSYPNLKFSINNFKIYGEHTEANY